MARKPDLCIDIACRQELSRRCETLIRLVEKENEDLDARNAAKGGKVKGVSSKAGASSSKEGGPVASGAAAGGGSSRKRKSGAAGAAGAPPSAKKGRSSASPAPLGA